METALAQRRRNFRQFVEHVKPRYQWYAHCERLGHLLERVAAGDLKRLMVFMPPRHGKSELVSRLFSAYYLHRYPDRWVGINSYAADLAYTLSRAARENYQEAGNILPRTATAVSHWETGKGGGLWAAGVGGPITGKGFHLGIIDDPLKNAEEAASEVIRARHQEWYSSTFSTREEPEGAVIVIQTRWHAQDLSGWLLAEEEEAEHPERWHLCSLAALREEEEDPIPASCTREPDWREVGAALCPERYSEERLARQRERSAYFFAALFQQRPRPREGNLFKLKWFDREAPTVPPDAPRVRAWDLAATSGRGDFSVGVKMARCPDGSFVIEHVRRGQWSPGERDAVILETAKTDGVACEISLEEEPGAAGKAQSEALIRMLVTFSAFAHRPTGDKETRAMPLASQMEIGAVRVAEGSFRSRLIEEFIAFPTGEHDDQVDAASNAFNRLASGGVIETSEQHHAAFWKRA